MTISSGRRGLSQQIERTCQVADSAQCDAGVVVGRFDPRMAKQHLNDPDVGLVLQQMTGEGMAQRMGRDALLDPSNLGCAPHRPADDVGGERIARDHAGEQPVFGMGKAVPFSQHRQQVGRQHDVTVLVALGLLDADHHSGGVEVADLEIDQFGDAQSGGVTGAQYDLVFEAGSGGEQAGNLVLAQDHRQLLGLLDVGDGGDQIVARCGDAVEESQCGERLVDHMHGIAAVDQMKAEEPQVVGGRLGGRAVQELSEDLDAVDISPVGLGREVAERHVVDQALAQRADGGVGHGGLLSRVRWIRSTLSRHEGAHRHGHRKASALRPLFPVFLSALLSGCLSMDADMGGKQIKGKAVEYDGELYFSLSEKSQSEGEFVLQSMSLEKISETATQADSTTPENGVVSECIGKSHGLVTIIFPIKYDDSNICDKIKKNVEYKKNTSYRFVVNVMQLDKYSGTWRPYLVLGKFYVDLNNNIHDLK